MFTGQHWRALGCRVDLLVVRGDAELARIAVERVLADVDATYSRFRPDSELMRTPADRDVVVSELLSTALYESLRAAKRTGGAVDPTVGSALRAFGIDRDWSDNCRV